MILRAAGSMDFEAMAAVHAESFPRPWSATDLGGFAQRPGACTLVAEAEEAPAGFILAWAVAGEAEILTLAVRPSLRGRGFGHALVEGVAGLCGQAGAEAMWLEVAQDNTAALALYRGCGFAKAGARPAYYDRGAGVPRVDAVVLRRRLDRSA